MLIIVVLICLSTYLLDKITLCMNLPNVTLPNMSHLVYITFFGETDGVTLSRLGCSFKIHDSLLLKWKPLKNINSH